MFKEILVPHLTPRDELSVNLVRPGYREKYANVSLADNIYRDLEDFKGSPGKSYMLVVAVTPCEYWGDNKNKDAFEEYWLKKNHPTFTTHGTFFKNHVNKDPLKNYGENALSWYDDIMKRVLVLVGVDHKKAPDIVNDLEMNKKISVSMGCKIPYDVCSICGNKAPTISQYCDDMKYHAGEIYPDGRKVFVYNPDPTFFDLSKVVRPAGHIEYIIKKVVPKNATGKLEIKNISDSEEGMDKAASLGSAALFNREQDFADKYARLNKMCTMTKVISGESVPEDEMPEKLQNIVKNSPCILSTKDNPIRDNDLKRLSAFPFKKIFSTSSLMGMPFDLSEIMKLFMLKSGDDEVVELQENMDRPEIGFDPVSLLQSNDVLGHLKDNPKVLKIIIKSNLISNDPKDADEKVASIIAPYFHARSVYPPEIESRPFLDKMAREETPLFPPTYEDQREFLSTEEGLGTPSREKAKDAVKKSVGLVGLGAALAGTSKVLLKAPKIKGKYFLPAALFANLWGYQKLMGDEPVSKFACEMDDGTLLKIGSCIDYYDRIKYANLTYSDDREMSYQCNTALNLEKEASEVWDWVQRNPELTTFLSLLGAGAAGRGIRPLSKVLSRMGSATAKGYRATRGGLSQAANKVRSGVTNANNAVRGGITNTQDAVRGGVNTVKSNITGAVDTIKATPGNIKSRVSTMVARTPKVPAPKVDPLEKATQKSLKNEEALKRIYNK